MSDGNGDGHEGVYATVAQLKDLQRQNERYADLKDSLVETRMMSEVSSIKSDIRSSNTLMKFTAAIVSGSVVALGVAMKLGWV